MDATPASKLREVAPVIFPTDFLLGWLLEARCLSGDTHVARHSENLWGQGLEELKFSQGVTVWEG
jgi:hypothetical protein